MAITLQQLCEVVGVVQGSAGQPTGLLGDVRRIAQIIESKERGDHLDPGSVARQSRLVFSPRRCIDSVPSFAEVLGIYDTVSPRTRKSIESADRR